MKQDVIRRRRTMSFPKIAYDTPAAIAAGMAGLGRPSGGVSDRRGVPGGEGHDAQGVDVAAVRVDGRHVAAIVATVVGSAMGMAGPVKVEIKSGLGGIYSAQVWKQQHEGQGDTMNRTEKNDVRDGLVQTVARLRELKAKSDEAEAKRGELDGTAWAMRTADVKDLQAMAEVGDEFNDPNQLGDEAGMELAQALAVAMFKLFGLEMTPEMLAVDVFPSLGSINSPHYIAGFARSALNVWTEVEEQVLA